MRRLVHSLIALGIVSAPILAAADDPPERAAQKAADAKKDLKNTSDDPMPAKKTGEKPTTEAAPTDKPKVEKAKKPKVEPKVKHAPHQGWTDKQLHDPTDASRR